MIKTEVILFISTFLAFTLNVTLLFVDVQQRQWVGELKVLLSVCRLEVQVEEGVRVAPEGVGASRVKGKKEPGVLRRNEGGWIVASLIQPFKVLHRPDEGGQTAAAGGAKSLAAIALNWAAFTGGHVCGGGGQVKFRLTEVTTHSWP